jgi:hypothetical protein
MAAASEVCGLSTPDPSTLGNNAASLVITRIAAPAQDTAARRIDAANKLGMTPNLRWKFINLGSSGDAAIDAALNS